MSTQTIESRSPQNQSEVVVSAPAADRETVAAAFSRLWRWFTSPLPG